MKATVIGVCASDRKGVRKTPVEAIRIIEDFGVEGDAHAGCRDRQVSLLAEESVVEVLGDTHDAGPGVFGENLRTRGIDLPGLSIGAVLRIGDVRLEVTRIGKQSPDGESLCDPLGMRIGPTKAVFCRVLRGGAVRPGDPIESAGYRALNNPNG